MMRPASAVKRPSNAALFAACVFDAAASVVSLTTQRQLAASGVAYHCYT